MSNPNPQNNDLRQIHANKLESPSPHNHSQLSGSGILTPIDIRSRGALGSQVRLRTINLSQNGGIQSPNISANILNTINESSEFHNTDVIWGTNINIKEIEDKFTNFLKTFTCSDNTNETQVSMSQNVYLEMLNSLHTSEQMYLDVDSDHIFQYDKKLYTQLIHFPSEVIICFDNAATRLYKDLFYQDMLVDSTGCPPIHVRTYNLRKTTCMRDLNPTDINHLVSIKGIVIRCSDIHPEMREAHFRCVNCGYYETSINEGGKIQEPNDCGRCRTKNSYELIHNMCMFMDRQYIKIQETPETVPDGETPQTVTIVAHDELVDSIRAGDRVEVTGIFKAQPMRVTHNRRLIRSIFNTYIDAISFALTLKQKFMTSDDQIENTTFFNEEVKKRILDISMMPNIYDMLVEALAPSIYENDDVKKGILCLLFGGTPKEFANSGRGQFRSESNVLLVGDPSTAKSQLLQYVHKIAPRGIYTSGKGSSAVGLTASITKDPETRELILESGALVLSDKGICCIDEFDKMDENTRVILHEAMEQQTISVAKAGIVCQLNARTSILASANPIESRYNPKRSVVENIKLPPTLISRFDLIYLMLDRPSEAADARLAHHILSLYTKESQMEIEQNKPIIDRELLSKYISYARKYCKPILSADSAQYLVNCYVEMRRMGTSRNIITATPRQLEALIRLSEALAKMRLSSIVEKTDVEEAVRLMKVATQQAATDPVTGQIDMDLISTGITAGSRNKISQLVDHLKEMMRAQEELYRKGVKFIILYEELKKKFDVMGVGTTEPFKEIEFREALNILEEDGHITMAQNRKQPFIKYLGTLNK